MTSLRNKIFQRMESLGQSPKKSLGQNFLISEHVVDKIINAATLSDFHKVIEVGPGLGALTDEIIASGVPLTVIELDQKFSDYWKQNSAITVINDDALAAPWGELIGKHKTVLISNLPYQISSRLVIDLSVAASSPQRMVLMFQKEVAKRIMAAASTPDYSLLSFVAQIFWKPRLLLEAGAVDFFPQPNVASRVIVFDRRGYLASDSQIKLLEFAKLCFEQKKKILGRRLGDRYGKEMVENAYKQLGIPDGARVTQLKPELLLALFGLLSGISLDPLLNPH